MIMPDRLGAGRRLWRVVWMAAMAALLQGSLTPMSRPLRPAARQGEKRPQSGALVPIQYAHTRDLAAGKFLVASRGLLDPNFAETVVLLVQYDEQGVVGLVINRPTKVLLSEAFPQLKETMRRSDAVYLGGPVERTEALALIRSRAKLAEARNIFADIYLTASRPVLEKALSSRSGPSMVHVYLGYAGWTAEQLRREVELGGWFIFPGDAATVFAANPDSIWQRWILKTEGQIASARTACCAPNVLRSLDWQPRRPAPGHARRKSKVKLAGELNQPGEVLLR